MKKEDIVIGTTYRIREWDGMVQEFGLDSRGNVSVSDDAFFSKEMRISPQGDGVRHLSR